MTPKATTLNDRSLLEHNPNGVKLWAIQVGRRTRYEVCAPSGTWTFGTLFMAIGKFDGLSKEKRAA
jgi:hypothetical protein